jgi:hypothetical protein
MNYYANVSIPIIELSQIYVAVLNYGNIIVICLILTFLGYIYTRSAITAEEKLEQEHQKTNAALIERNQATQLRTPNYVIGGMSDGTYQKKECLVGEQNKLYIFSDGVYEVEKSDGSMWRFQEFSDFMSNVKTNGQSILDRLYIHAKNLGNSENFEDDFTIVEVVFG